MTRKGTIVFFIVLAVLALINICLDRFYGWSLMRLLDGESIISKIVYISFVTMIITQIIVLPKEN